MADCICEPCGDFCSCSCHDRKKGAERGEEGSIPLIEEDPAKSKSEM